MIPRMVSKFFSTLSVALALSLASGHTYAVPFIVTWQGSFGLGVSFNGQDVSGQTWVVRQYGDTSMVDDSASPNDGQFYTFSTQMDIAAIGEYGLIADYGSGLQQGIDGLGDGYISLVSENGVYCYLCGIPAALPVGFDANTLSPLGPLDLTGSLGAYFGYSSNQPDAPLSSFMGGTKSFDGDYANNQITAVSTQVPAPGTAVLFGAGLLGLGWSRRRRV